MTQALVLLAVFVSVLIIAFAMSRAMLRRNEIARNVGRVSQRNENNEEINRILGSENEQIRYYLEVVQNEPADSLRMRLVQAGYFSKSALARFNLIRFVVSVLTFILVQQGLSFFIPSLGLLYVMLIAAAVAGMAFILTSAILEAIGKRRTREFRKLFPDFMDLLLVCVDAGLSINAAIDRVTREFLLTTPDFGIQLGIINLEVRAGRPLHEALSNFSRRINVQEASTLAVLFKQSEELGASVSKTLRVFSAEMRQLRLIRAEEKANALPIKMLFPMALFMFPVNLVIVLVPILMIIMQMLSGLSPS